MRDAAPRAEGLPGVLHDLVDLAPEPLALEPVELAAQDLPERRRVAVAEARDARVLRLGLHEQDIIEDFPDESVGLLQICDSKCCQ